MVSTGAHKESEHVKAAAVDTSETGKEEGDDELEDLEQDLEAQAPPEATVMLYHCSTGGP